MARTGASMTQGQFPNEQTIDGQYDRQEDAFRDWVTDDGSSRYPATKGRYHLYVSWACPWAHRTVIVRSLKRLGNVVGMTVVDPIRDDRGWAFQNGPGHTTDPVNGFQFLREAYAATEQTFSIACDRAGLVGHRNNDELSVTPMTILCVCSIRSFHQFTQSPIDLYPEDLQQKIDELNAFIYENVAIMGCIVLDLRRPNRRMNRR